MVRVLSLLSAVLVVGMFAVAAKGDGGGANIASAPNIPVGSTFVSGTTNSTGCYQPAEFWRLPVSSGDRLVLQYSRTNDYSMSALIFPPDVTDFTWSDRCRAPVIEKWTGSNGKAELSWIATRSGRWILLARAAGPSLGYEMRARIERYTRVSLKAPRLVPADKPFKVTGTVSGVNSGKVALLLMPGKKRAVVSISSKGAFTWTTRAGQPGRYTIRATYYGDDSHRASSARSVVRVG